MSGTEALPTQIFRSRKNEDEVKNKADSFVDRFDGKKASVEARKAETTTMVNEYYDLVTDLYEYGWGQNFHFAPRYSSETFNESIIRHEHFLASSAGFTPQHHILDLGCGVGGPARNMVRLTGMKVMGVNNNEYQIGRARRHDSRLGLTNHLNYTKTDFCNMCFEDNSFDGAYAIEATCHASDKVKCFSEVFRCIKPGSVFACYEWVVTDKYDDNNEEHRRIRHGIELGDALPDLETGKMVTDAMKAAGFVVEEAYDAVEKMESSPAKNIPWYQPLLGSYTSPSGFKSTPIGRRCTMLMCSAMEKMRLAPAGTRKATDILEEAAVNLVLGGQKGIFTPCYYVRARKPLN